MSGYFILMAYDKPGLHEVRKRIRPLHRAYLRNPSPHLVVVRLGGPILDAENERMKGTLLVVEAGSVDEVERFFQDDPYYRSELFERFEIHPWDWGLGNPDLRV